MVSLLSECVKCVDVTQSELTLTQTDWQVFLLKGQEQQKNN